MKILIKTVMLIFLVALAGCKESSDQLPDVRVTPAISTVKESTYVILKGEWSNKSKLDFTIDLSYKFKKVGSNKFLEGSSSSHRVTSENQGSFGLEDKMNFQVAQLQLTYVLKKGETVLLTRQQELKKEGLAKK